MIKIPTAEDISEQLKPGSEITGDVAELSDLSIRVLQEHKAKILELFGREAFQRCLRVPYDFFVAAYQVPLNGGLDMDHVRQIIEGAPNSELIAKVGETSHFGSAGYKDWFYGEIHRPEGDPNNFISYMALKYFRSDEEPRVGLRVLTSDPKYAVLHKPFNDSMG